MFLGPARRPWVQQKMKKAEPTESNTRFRLFPLGQVKDGIAEALAGLFKSLMDDFKTNSFRSYRGASEFQQFRWEKAKPIIDEIDRVLAQHYGFIDEELDFIINYDIKYRMGLSACEAGGADGEEEEGPG